MFLPIVSYFTGYWFDYFSSALYSKNISQIEFFIEKAKIYDLPPELALSSKGNMSLMMASISEFQVPPHPNLFIYKRFFQNFCRQYGLSSQSYIEIYRKRNFWTKEFVLVSTEYCN